MDSQAFVALIEKISTRRISLRVSGLPEPRTNIVYMALGGDECLYVGMSVAGLSRPFKPDHHVLAKHWDEIETLEVYEVATRKDAEYLEAVMVREFSPKYNKRKLYPLVWTGYRSNVAKVIAAHGA